MTGSGSTRLHCPGCGSAFALEAVAAYPAFACSVCGTAVIVPTAVSSAPLPPPLPPRPSTEPATAPVAHTRAPQQQRPTGGRGSHKPRRGRQRRAGAGPGGPAIGAAIGVALIAVAGVAIGLFGKGDADGDRAVFGSGDGDGDGDASIAEDTSRSDPRVDAAVWRALPAAERARLVDETLAALDKSDSRQLEWTARFFAERGETAARERVAELAVAADPNGSTWAHGILGRVDADTLVDEVLAACPRAEEQRTDAVARLEDLARRTRPKSGRWLVSGEEAAAVRALVAEVRADEARLADDYGYGVARWVTYRRTLEVMKDFPAVHEAAGPYVVFAQCGDAGADIPAEDSLEMRRARRILNETTSLFEALYDGWHEELGPHFGFTRYGPENATFDTLLKINVFSQREEFDLYNARRRVLSPYAGGMRAYYSAEEPRFVVSHDGKSESTAETYRVLCSQGVHQLVHFYSRELTQRARGGSASWSDCSRRPLWSMVGFSEFFASFEREGGAYRWMQPTDKDMQTIWIGDQAFAQLKWRAWSLTDLLTVDSTRQLTAAAAKRTPGPPAGTAMTEEWRRWRGAVEGVFVNLFYARAWSLVHFLWHAEERGKPKYRQKYIDYLKREWTAPDPDNAFAEDGVWTESLFFDAFELFGPDDMRLLDEEWRAWTRQLVDERQTAAWLPARHRMFKLLGVR